jgi:hypothetical protein
MKKASDSAGFGRKAMTLIAAVALCGGTAASVAQAISAAGGTITMDGGYTIHTFTNSGTFTITSPGVIEVLLVGGGGGGGGGLGGGGGGGGAISMPAMALTNGAYSIVVGAGGAGGGPGQANGNNGSASTSFSALAAGGGGGGHYPDVAGVAGGSGGGAGSVQDGTPSGGSATGSSLGGNTGTIYGNCGGTQTAARGGGDPTSARGGGGAGAPGDNQNPQNTPGGDGGIGITNVILGTNYYWGGGGAGAAHSGYKGGTGGLGGGGGGSSYDNIGGLGGGSALNPGLGATGGHDQNGGAGGANTGGGGGGGTWMNSTGGNGGSGIVVIRYLADANAPAIANVAASNVLTTSAFFNGYLSATGSSPVTVSVLWGVTDGGADPSAFTWANTNTFAPGQWLQGDYPATNITTLLSDSDYYYTYFAVNATSTNVAAPSQYFITGELNVYAVDPLFGSNALDTATFVVTRPSTCTAKDLPFNYTLSGTATNGVDYNFSWSSGGPTIPAGQTNATLTVTPIINANNFQTTRSLLVTLNPGAYALGTASNANGAFQSFPMNFIWNNAEPGQQDPPILDPANWTPAGQFLNIFGVICDVNAGGNAFFGWGGGMVVVNFNAQLNVYSNAMVSGGGYRTLNCPNLHLRGGTIDVQETCTYNGNYAVDNNSILLQAGNDSATVNATFSGAGNLCISNNITGTPDSPYAFFTLFTANNTNYSGVWSFYSTWVGTMVFAGDVGTGGLNFGPMSSNISINVNTACPWTLDLRGGKVFSGYQGWSSDRGTANPVHTGTFTLLSDSIISANGWMGGVLLTINGRITGIGRLRTWALSAQNPGPGNAIKLGGASDYTGGTVVMTNILEAATAGSLGAGNVEVQPGAKLQVDVSATMNPQAKLYLDSNGVMDLGAGSVTTTVSHAFIGGTGGWQAPSGYMELAPGGTYTKDSPVLAAYLVNNGVLKVMSATGLTVFIQ